MWTEKERELFTQANRAIVSGQYAEGLHRANKLLGLVSGSDLKWAYVSGCQQAVALRHLGRREKASEVFGMAHQRAEAAGEFVIAAYINVDWSSEEPDPHKAINMVYQAIHVCENATGTPDPERCLVADIAYFQVILAVHAARAGMRGIAPHIVIDARRALKRHAYGDHPRYKGAYLVALMHERRLTGSVSTWRALMRWARAHGLVALEVARQRKVRAAISTLTSPRRRRQLYLDEPT
ncbi:MAG TPA: hypothetical protein VM581_00160 [Magnetospirillaceae bacterium]|nr:hypothetical protein [Magnetospirillaceae bacterium]